MINLKKKVSNPDIHTRIMAGISKTTYTLVSYNFNNDCTINSLNFKNIKGDICHSFMSNIKIKVELKTSIKLQDALFSPHETNSCIFILALIYLALNYNIYD